jgi:CRP-like cAMP-binding protein
MDQYLIKTNCLECKRSSDCFTQRIDYCKDFFSIEKAHINFKKGETIIKEGTFVSSIYYILDGLAKVYLEGPNKNVIIKIIKADDFLGLTSIFSNHTYYFSATALSDTTICSIDMSVILRLLSENCKFTQEVVKWYCGNYNLMFTKCFNLGQKQLNGKLASTLLYLNHDKFKSVNIYSYLTRKDLAELSGMALESVARILSKFNDDKIIKLKGKKVEILNMELLKSIDKNG